MQHSVTEMGRAVRRRLERVVHKSRDKDYARRALAILHLWESEGNVAQAADRVRAARSSVYRWQSSFETYGEEGLCPQPRGRSDWKANDEVLSLLETIVGEDPRELGYLRSRWSSELLSLELARRSRVEVHATTVRRWLARLEYRYRRARPTLHRRDPRKAQRLQAIEAALAEEDPYTEVFFADEVDVDLNPRIGSAWMRRGEQTAVPTPGQNEKHYIAGALHAHTGRLVWVEHPRKNSVLFVKLLEQLRSHYRRANRIVLILDNYRIHKSQLVERWLENNPKFQLLFQPSYHPWVNVIERLWKAMHDTVTRTARAHRRCTSPSSPRHHLLFTAFALSVTVGLLSGPMRSYPVREVRCSSPLGADLGGSRTKELWRWRDIWPGDRLVFHQILPIPREPGQARHSALPARNTQVLCQRPRTAMLSRMRGILFLPPRARTPAALIRSGPDRCAAREYRR